MDLELKQYLDLQFANVVRKDDLLDVVRKSDLLDVVRKDDLLEFITKNDLRSIKTQLDSMQETLNEVNKRDLEDSNAFAKDIVNHDIRITKVEKEIKVLQLQ